MVALIVSPTQKGTDYISQTLKAFSIQRIVAVKSGQEARRFFGTQDFDLAVINAPLGDETGEMLSKDFSTKGMCQVILIVKAEKYDAISDQVEEYGVITVPNPINKTLFFASLKLARATHNRLLKVHKENVKLSQKIEDIRIVDRAKCVLISHMSLTEQEAHRYIEKLAMDQRSSRRKVAEGIIRTYEN